MRLLPTLTVVAATAAILAAQAPAQSATPTPAMTLTIPGFPDGTHIPVKFSQANPNAAPGEGTSPAMTWANVPSGTQSLFLHFHVHLHFDRRRIAHRNRGELERHEHGSRR